MTTEAPFDRDRFLVFASEYALQTDRAAGVVIGVHLDAALTSVLRAYFIHMPSLTTRLFEDGHVLGTLSAKIDLSHALGLLTARMASSLHTLRKIRNDCAHADSIDFAKPPTSDQAASLLWAEYADRVRETLPAPLAVQSLPRLQVFISAFLLAGTLHSLSDRVRARRPLEPPPSLTALIKTWSGASRADGA